MATTNSKRSTGKGKGKRAAGKGKGPRKATAAVVKAIAADLTTADKSATDALRHRIAAGKRIAERGSGVSFATLSEQLKDAKCTAHGTSVQPLNHMAQVHTAYVAPKDGVTLDVLATLGALGIGIGKLREWAKVAEADGPKGVVETLRKDPNAKPPKAAKPQGDRVLISLTATDDVAAWRALVDGDEKPADTLRRLMAEVQKRRAADKPARSRKTGRSTLPDRPTA